MQMYPWWRLQMETFSALLTFCAGNSSVKGHWRGALMFSLICAPINSHQYPQCWLNIYCIGAPSYRNIIGAVRNMKNKSNLENNIHLCTSNSYAWSMEYAYTFQYYISDQRTPCMPLVLWLPGIHIVLSQWTQPDSEHSRHHDDVIKWKHFLRYWPFVWGIHRSPVNSPHKGQWRGALMFFYDLGLNKRLSKQS